MKLKTLLLAAGAAGVAYVLGTEAGRVRFEQAKVRAREIIGSPPVQEAVAGLSDTVKQNAHRLPEPVAGVVSVVADGVTASTATLKSPTTP